MNPSRWLDFELLVCVGTGGVGKTTVAAALALEAARRGRRALVVTIDPARRLADALGTGALTHEAREVPLERLASAGVKGGGSLAAMMLDTKRTFDALVARYAPDPESLERILENPIYRNLTDALSGSREYSAMECLHQLHATGDWDTIVLDTPPSRHALEFLDAPRRLTGFLESSLLRLLFRPASAVGLTGLRLFRMGSERVLSVIERVTGLEFLRAISEFLLAFESMLDGFTERAREVETLLRSSRCGFVLVAGANPDQVSRATSLYQGLEREQIRLVGLVVNRLRVWVGGDAPPAAQADLWPAAGKWFEKALGDAEDGAVVLELLERQATLARRDARYATELERGLPLARDAARRVPLLGGDVCNIESLSRLASHVFEERPRGG